MTETELTRALRGLDTTAGPPVLPESDVAYVEYDAPVGRLLLSASERGVLTCSYAPTDPLLARLSREVSPRILRGGLRLDPLRRELDDYFAGRLRTFTVPVDPALSGAFQRTVLSGLAEVGYGARTTYGELARSVGAPRGARAVGTALGANPVCLVRPCHRVVRADGSRSGYAGGPAAKTWLLEFESAH